MGGSQDGQDGQKDSMASSVTGKEASLQSLLPRLPALW